METHERDLRHSDAELECTNSNQSTPGGAGRKHGGAQVGVNTCVARVTRLQQQWYLSKLTGRVDVSQG